MNRHSFIFLAEHRVLVGPAIVRRSSPALASAHEVNARIRTRGLR